MPGSPAGLSVPKTGRGYYWSLKIRSTLAIFRRRRHKHGHTALHVSWLASSNAIGELRPEKVVARRPAPAFPALQAHDLARENNSGHAVKVRCSERTLSIA